MEPARLLPQLLQHDLISLSSQSDSRRHETACWYISGNLYMVGVTKIQTQGRSGGREARAAAPHPANAFPSFRCMPLRWALQDPVQGRDAEDPPIGADHPGANRYWNPTKELLDLILPKITEGNTHGRICFLPKCLLIEEKTYSTVTKFRVYILPAQSFHLKRDYCGECPPD